MMNKFLTLLLVILSFTEMHAAPISGSAEPHQIIKVIHGDLDKDGIDEMVIAFNTAPKSPEEEVLRELQILKLIDGEYKLWKSSKDVLYGPHQGGMKGDPFCDMSIKNGVLIITQAGGSSWYWGFTERYRYQNGQFELIGYTGDHGKACCSSIKADFNVSTGKIIFSVHCEDDPECSDIDCTKMTKTFYHKGLKLTLNNRRVEEVKIPVPDSKEVILL